MKQIIILTPSIMAWSMASTRLSQGSFIETLTTRNRLYRLSIPTATCIVSYQGDDAWGYNRSSCEEAQKEYTLATALPATRTSPALRSN
ncbi:hypothetical protein F4818DRAFT_432277 [Hypoxylon cercidicola]|nr:hypothetical protein F4818DRAFT_432277 [Hypoxylon cercidicola]